MDGNSNVVVEDPDDIDEGKKRDSSKDCKISIQADDKAFGSIYVMMNFIFGTGFDAERSIVLISVIWFDSLNDENKSYVVAKFDFTTCLKFK